MVSIGLLLYQDIFNATYSFWILQVIACIFRLGPPNIICVANEVAFGFIGPGPIDFKTKFIILVYTFWWCSFFELLGCFVRYTHIFKKYYVVSSSVLVFCKITFSFIFWTMKLEKSEQTVVSHVLIDLNKTAFLLIILTLWKKFETSSEVICPWFSILGSKALKSFILASSLGISVFIIWRI